MKFAGWLNDHWLHKHSFASAYLKGLLADPFLQEEPSKMRGGFDWNSFWEAHLANE